MKNKIIFTIFIALAFIFYNNLVVSADSVTSDNGFFKIEVGNKGYVAPVHDSPFGYGGLNPIEPSETGLLRFFNVSINPKDNEEDEDEPNNEVEIEPSYMWKHTMCFVVNGVETGCEEDIIESNEGLPFTPSTSFDTSFYADQDKIPFFYKDVEDNISVTFKNSFICIENCLDDIVLDDITLIVDDHPPVLDLDNSIIPERYSILSGETEFKFSYEDNIGIDEDRLMYIWTRKTNISFDEFSEGYTNGLSFFSAPPYFLTHETTSYYLVVLAFDYAGNNAYEYIEYRFNSTATQLEVGTDSLLPVDNKYYNELNFKIDNPNNHINFKYEVVRQLDFLHLDDINTPFDPLEEVSVNNFTLEGTYFLYITSEDEVGNRYGLIIRFRVDLSLPYFKTQSLTFPSEQEIYQEVKGKIEFGDSLSGIDENRLYYLWSNTEIDLENEYSLINIPYTNNSNIELEGVDGTWYLYFLVYDNANNFGTLSFQYTFDNTAPVLSEERTKNEPSTIASDHSVYINVTDLNGLESESFLCGWFLKGVEVTNSYTLKDTCLNKTFVNSPKGLEGEYVLWFYVSDIVGNFAYLRSENVYSIDTKNPELLYDIVNDHLEYSEINEVFINFSDSYSGIDETSFKYKWLPKGETPSSSNILEKRFSNESYINYPFNYYGEFRLWLSAKDKAGNEYFAPLNEIFKIDTGIITLEISGESTIKIIKGEKFSDPGATAYKGESLYNGRIIDVDVSTNLDLSKPGTYFIEYTSGEGANRVVVTRTVVVEESHYLIIILITAFISGISTYIYQLIRKSWHN
ncbi:TPA: DUF5011 domain-containing protein [bacterium]|nr:DUF5011 domain-containing protein [bacterium]